MPGGLAAGVPLSILVSNRRAGASAAWRPQRCCIRRCRLRPRITRIHGHRSESLWERSKTGGLGFQRQQDEVKARRFSESDGIEQVWLTDGGKFKSALCQHTDLSVHTATRQPTELGYQKV